MEYNSIQTNPQAQTMRKVGFFMNIAMGITVSIILSTHGVLASGHFSVPSLAISMVVSCSLALCIGFFLPVKPVKDKITANMKMPAKFLVANIITNIFYVLIITSVNTSLFITLAKHAMEVNNVPLSVPRPSILAALLVPGDFNHSVTGEKSQKAARGNDQKSHLTPLIIRFSEDCQKQFLPFL